MTDPTKYAKAAARLIALLSGISEYKGGDPKAFTDGAELLIDTFAIRPALAERDELIGVLESANDVLRSEHAALLASLAEVEADNSTLRGDIYKEAARRRSVEAERDAELAELRTEVERLRAAHNGEVCVDTMEYCEKLKAENERLTAKLTEAEDQLLLIEDERDEARDSE